MTWIRKKEVFTNPLLTAMFAVPLPLTIEGSFCGKDRQAAWVDSISLVFWSWILLVRWLPCFIQEPQIVPQASICFMAPSSEFFGSAVPSLPATRAKTGRPTSLAIWHRGCSHRRPNRNRSPNCKHFASLDLKKHADFWHRRPTSHDFLRRFFLAFPCDFRSSEWVFASLGKKIFASQAIWGCAIRIASHIAVASRDSGH